MKLVNYTTKNHKFRATIILEKNSIHHKDKHFPK